MTPEKEIQAYCDMLWSHIAEAGYPEPAFREVDQHLKLTREDLRGMTAEELAEVEFDLKAASFAVQDEFNRQKAKEARCQTVLAKLVGRKLPQDVYNNSDKWMTAALKDDEARGYWYVMQNARTACLRLEGQSYRLAELAKSLNNLIYARR